MSLTTGAAATPALLAQTDCPPVPRFLSPCKLLAPGRAKPAGIRLHHMTMGADVLRHHQMLGVFFNDKLCNFDVIISLFIVAMSRQEQMVSLTLAAKWSEVYGGETKDRI